MRRKSAPLIFLAILLIVGSMWDKIDFAIRTRAMRITLAILLGLPFMGLNVRGQMFSDGLTIDSVHSDFTDVVLIDFDSDGDQDVFAVSQKDSLYYYENLGGLVFDTAQHLYLNYQTSELYIERRGGELYTMRETFGYFTSSYSDPFIYSNPTHVLQLYLTESLPVQLRLRDLDGDGQENDLIYMDDNPIGNQVWVQQNYEWPPRLLHQAANYYQDFSDVEVGDFNMDGFPDIVICDYYSWSVIIYMGGGDCGFVKTYEGFAEGPPYGAPYPIDMEIIDSPLDGVNQEVVLIGFEPSFISRLPIDTNGVVIQPIPEPEINCRSLAAITSADFDMDGHTDIVSYGVNTGYPFISEAVCEEEGVGQNRLFFYDGGMNFEGTASFGSFESGTDVNVYGNHEELKAGDLDGDGDIDIVLGTKNLQVFENKTLDCSTHVSPPVGLSKSYSPVPFPDGVIDRVQLKWYKDSPQIKYSPSDNAACDIEFWPVRDLLTGEDLNHLPHSLLEKKTHPNQDLWKWPIKFYRPDVMPNTRYKWRVRCYCNAGDGPVSPWSETKFFATPDFDPNTGVFEGKLADPEYTLTKSGDTRFLVAGVSVGEVLVYDLSGREVLRDHLRGEVMDLGELSPGVYLVQLLSESGIVLSEKVQLGK